MQSAQEDQIAALSDASEEMEGARESEQMKEPPEDEEADREKKGESASEEEKTDVWGRRAEDA